MSQTRNDHANSDYEKIPQSEDWDFSDPGVTSGADVETFLTDLSDPASFAGAPVMSEREAVTHHVASQMTHDDPVSDTAPAQVLEEDMAEASDPFNDLDGDAQVSETAKPGAVDMTADLAGAAGSGVSVDAVNKIITNFEGDDEVAVDEFDAEMASSDQAQDEIPEDDEMADDPFSLLEDVEDVPGEAEAAAASLATAHDTRDKIERPAAEPQPEPEIAEAETDTSSPLPDPVKEDDVDLVARHDNSIAEDSEPADSEEAPLDDPEPVASDALQGEDDNDDTETGAIAPNEMRKKKSAWFKPAALAAGLSAIALFGAGGAWLYVQQNPASVLDIADRFGGFLPGMDDSAVDEESSLQDFAVADGDFSFEPREDVAMVEFDDVDQMDTLAPIDADPASTGQADGGFIFAEPDVEALETGDADEFDLESDVSINDWVDDLASRASGDLVNDEDWSDPAIGFDSHPAISDDALPLTDEFDVAITGAVADDIAGLGLRLDALEARLISLEGVTQGIPAGARIITDIDLASTHALIEERVDERLAATMQALGPALTGITSLEMRVNRMEADSHQATMSGNTPETVRADIQNLGERLDSLSSDLWLIARHGLNGNGGTGSGLGGVSLGEVGALPPLSTEAPEYLAPSEATPSQAASTPPAAPAGPVNAAMGRDGNARPIGFIADPNIREGQFAVGDFVPGHGAVLAVRDARHGEYLVTDNGTLFAAE